MKGKDLLKHLRRMDVTLRAKDRPIHRSVIPQQVISKAPGHIEISNKLVNKICKSLSIKEIG
jgi:hypothetical protein